MRGLVILFVLGIVGCIVGVVVVGRMMGDQGVPIAYAFGNPDADTVEMHVVVAMGMTQTERPRVDFETQITYWDEIPRIGGKSRYRYKLETPTGEQKISRPTFELVK